MDRTQLITEIMATRSDANRAHLEGLDDWYLFTAHLSVCKPEIIEPAKPAPKAKRVLKGERYVAQRRVGSRVVHIGTFDTPEERDAAVFAHRLGVLSNGCK